MSVPGDTATTVQPPTPPPGAGDLPSAWPSAGPFARITPDGTIRYLR